MRGLVALDWQRVCARPARLLMPVLALLIPVLHWPLAGLDRVAEARVRARLERHRAGGGSAILVTQQPLDLAFDLQRVLAIGSA